MTETVEWIGLESDGPVLCPWFALWERVVTQQLRDLVQEVGTGMIIILHRVRE